jgi:hypothetical protein
MPEDLYRAGTPSKSKFDYLRTMPPRKLEQVYDVKINPDTNIIEASSGGLSMFDKPNYKFGKDWWVMPKGTKLPNGFTISKDLTDGKFKGHYTIRSLSNISVDSWKRIFKLWGEENAIHINSITNRQAL